MRSGLSESLIFLKISFSVPADLDSVRRGEKNCNNERIDFLLNNADGNRLYLRFCRSLLSLFIILYSVLWNVIHAATLAFQIFTASPKNLTYVFAKI